MRTLVATVVTWPMLLAVGCAQTNAAEIPTSVAVYARAIRSDSTQDIEKLYRLGLRAADDLLANGEGEAGTVLEALSDADYHLAQEEMEGFAVYREEAVGAVAHPAFFERLSRKRADHVSQDFFNTVAQVSDSTSGTWPAYIEQLTDFTGCPKFGSLELVRCYGVLKSYQRRHPGRYADRVHGLLEPLEEELTSGLYPCGTKQDVEREFREFLRRFPNAPIAGKVRERLRLLEDDKLPMHFGSFPH